MGDKKPPEWRIWRKMIERCYYKTSVQYPRWGGRGITVCDRWRGKQGFVHFLEDMGKRPSNDHSIDRIDNSKGYRPDNCRWTTRLVQANNTRNNLWVAWNGRKYTLSQLLHELGIYDQYRSIHKRIFERGWSVEAALSEPFDRNRRLSHKQAA